MKQSLLAFLAALPRRGRGEKSYDYTYDPADDDPHATVCTQTRYAGLCNGTFDGTEVELVAVSGMLPTELAVSC